MDKLSLSHLRLSALISRSAYNSWRRAALRLAKEMDWSLATAVAWLNVRDQIRADRIAFRGDSEEFRVHPKQEKKLPAVTNLWDYIGHQMQVATLQLAKSRKTYECVSCGWDPCMCDQQ